MNLKINHIITLDNQEKYLVLNNAILGGKKYFLGIQVDEEEQVIPNKVIVMEEVINNKELFIRKITSKDLLAPLMRIFKAQNTKI